MIAAVLRATALVVAFALVGCASEAEDPPAPSSPSPSSSTSTSQTGNTTQAPAPTTPDASSSASQIAPGASQFHASYARHAWCEHMSSECSAFVGTHENIAACTGTMADQLSCTETERTACERRLDAIVGARDMRVSCPQIKALPAECAPCVVPNLDPKGS